MGQFHGNTVCPFSAGFVPVYHPCRLLMSVVEVLPWWVCGAKVTNRACFGVLSSAEFPVRLTILILVGFFEVVFVGA
jgi:hypothetical protein